MSEESKTYVFGNEGNGSMAALISALANNNNMAPLLASMNGGFGGEMGAFFILILFAMIFQNGGWGGNGQSTDAILASLNNNAGRDMIMQAVNGNQTAISQLASTLNCDINAVQSSLSSINSGICSISNQVGLSGQQVINAIQQGDAALASQLAQCCCENRLLTTQQGYESRIATMEQTNQLGSKIDQQTSFLSDKFCDLEKREMQSKIDALREERSSLLNQISNTNQTLAIQSYVAGLVNPLATDVASIKASMPNTVPVVYPNLSAVPTSYLYGYGNFSSNSIWS